MLSRRKFVQSAASGLFLPAMAQAGLVSIGGARRRHPPVGGGGESNPDGYANYTTVYRESTFPDSSTDAPFNPNGDLVTQTFLPTGGYAGKTAWQFEFDQNTGEEEGVESQSGHGFKWWPAAGNDPDETPIVCIGGRIWISQKFVDEAMSTSHSPWAGGKLIDIHCWNEAGDNYQTNTRQLLGLAPVRTAEDGIFSATGVVCPVGLYFSLVNGGAGGQWCYDNVNAPYDLSEHAEEWVEFRVVFDAVGERTLLYFKAENDAQLTRSCIRDTDDYTGNFSALPEDERSYNFTSRGWSLNVDTAPGYGSYYFAYWQGMRYTFTPLPSMKFDHIICANGWVPFTL